MTGEDFGDLEWLREEALDFASARNHQLIIFRQLIHTQNGNDILQRFVVLEDLLDTSSNVVVTLTHDVRIPKFQDIKSIEDLQGLHDTRSRIERIDSRIDGQLGNTTRQHSSCVQVSESRSWSRIRQVISRHVDSLEIN
jgi:peptide chain release factor 1